MEKSLRKFLRAIMTELLQQAIAALEQLPEETQDAIATHLLFEIVAFDNVFARGGDRAIWLWRSLHLSRSHRAISAAPYSLRGTPVRYVNPTEPVASGDWEAV